MEVATMRVLPCLQGIMASNEPVLLPANGVEIVLARPGEAHGLRVVLVVVADDEVLAARQLVENGMRGEHVGSAPEAEIAEYPHLIRGLHECLPGSDQALIHFPHGGERAMRILDYLRMIEVVVGGKPKHYELILRPIPNPSVLAP